jgi:hypothetical protein
VRSPVEPTGGTSMRLSTPCSRRESSGQREVKSPHEADLPSVFNSRSDPSIKRTFCSKCYTVLVPGLTSKTRVKGEQPEKNQGQDVSSSYFLYA